jgi:hypothetical protein
VAAPPSTSAGPAVVRRREARPARDLQLDVYYLRNVRGRRYLVPERHAVPATGAVAAAAVRRALAAGLVPQWRARITLMASRRIATSLGFVELGRQASFRLAAPP